MHFSSQTWTNLRASVLIGSVNVVTGYLIISGAAKPLGLPSYSFTHEWYSSGCSLRRSATCASGSFQSENQQGTLCTTRRAMSVRYRQAGAYRCDKRGRCYHQGAHKRTRAVCANGLLHYHFRTTKIDFEMTTNVQGFRTNCVDYSPSWPAGCHRILAASRSQCTANRGVQ